MLKGRLLIFFSLVTIIATGQPPPAQLHIKKNGKIKKRVEQGDGVHIENKDGYHYGGVISYMFDDTIMLNGNVPIPVADIHQIKLDHEKRMPRIPIETFGWVALGVVLTTFGLAATGLESWESAAITAVAIGFTPIVFMFIKSISFKKYKYRIGRKYTLRVWDLN